ncbi:hypothetical protein E2C01_012972 [Portunus trituberculatus]|uniref:Uncharacterized protein n=1 Tax=Portunus trituberculatus TaxID=210409 RepID=A0A5B7DF06_PORTR|nr:hypothetical protein [Portunus trituberculatus]
MTTPKEEAHLNTPKKEAHLNTPEEYGHLDTPTNSCQQQGTISFLSYHPGQLDGLEGRSGIQTCWCHLALTSDWPDRRALRGLGVAEAMGAVGGLVPDTVRHTRLCDTHYIARIGPEAWVASAMGVRSPTTGGCWAGDGWPDRGWPSPLAGDVSDPMGESNSCSKALGKAEVSLVSPPQEQEESLSSWEAASSGKVVSLLRDASFPGDSWLPILSTCPAGPQ